MQYGGDKILDEWNVPKPSSSSALCMMTSAPPAPANTGVQRTWAQSVITLDRLIYVQGVYEHVKSLDKCVGK